MRSKELDKALIQRKQAEKEYRRLIAECEKERSEDSALIQAEKEQKELYSKYSDAHKAWNKLNDKFNKEHEQLLESLDSAWRYRREVEKLIAGIINKIKG